MPLWKTIGDHISSATGTPFSVARHSAAGGGCINAAHVIEGNGQRFFVKTNEERLLDMFEAEAAGLQAILQTGAIKAPAPICYGTAESQSFIVLEYLELDGNSGASAESLGRELAQMHRATRRNFGWQRNNTIGSTPQINTPCDNWVGFWREHRLGFQLKLATQNGFCGGLQKKGAQLLEIFPALFAGYTPQPSLLHGDLWGGNYATVRGGQPVIFDPAVYYGDREADLAMTELFGGFPARFYAAYRETWPLDSGYAVRKILYNLYHILNHANLFGGGYAGQAEGMMDNLLAEIR
jgi:fructosamine-3-kinase